MMGGTGEVAEPIELNDIDLSAIGEAMNQMVGSSSTSLSSMVKKKIDIDTPKAFVLDFNSDDFLGAVGFKAEDAIACISFRMEIGTLIDSEIMQIIPVDFAKDMVNKMMDDIIGPAEPAKAAPAPAPAPAAQAAPAPAPAPAPMPAAQPAPAPMPAPAPAAQAPYQQPYPQPMYQQPYPQPAMYQQPYQPQVVGQPAQNINVQPAQFQPLNIEELSQQKENIGIIMDVPLEVTVELGRTKKKIREILEFSPGTIVDLDKLAGEPIDILVNGKFVATGEVVVMDENFAVRVTDIIAVEKRI
jgi:flagellar motor switch protein FliN/FliY